MLRISPKKLDVFLSKQFLVLFVGAFLICQFVLMMQFLWRYVDELIGKGLSMEVLAEFFWYMGLMLVPQALPLAILLSSLITFGNLGESSELTAIKAAGISLMRSFQSLIVLCVLISVSSFIFQNYVGPDANLKLRQLLISMKQKSPELEIPEGIFYDGIPRSNIYVQKKDMRTGKLYGLTIYRMTGSYEDQAIILADSGMLQTTADKKHLLMTLWNGEWFENMQSQEMGNKATVPYRRETFYNKEILIDFDGDFSLTDATMLANDARSKGLPQLIAAVDSLEHRQDSLGRGLYADISLRYYRPARYSSTVRTTRVGPVKNTDSSRRTTKQDGGSSPTPSPTANEKATSGAAKATDKASSSAADKSGTATPTEAKATDKTSSSGADDKTSSAVAMAEAVDIDSVYLSLSQSDRQTVVTSSINTVNSCRRELEFRAMIAKDTDVLIVTHRIQEISKFTIALQCMLFFFIGAPLGAIIRKGGLGLPVIISVAVFITYYILDNSSTRMVKIGELNLWVGTLMSTVVLSPLAVYFTYKANRDSTVFNFDVYKEWLRRFFMLRTTRHIMKKEVIITDPAYATDQSLLTAMNQDILSYERANHLRRLPNPIRIFFYYESDDAIKELSNSLEAVIDDLANTDNKYILNDLNKYPLLSTTAHKRPFSRQWLNITTAILVPIGLFVYIRIVIFRRRLYRDLHTIRLVNESIIAHISDSYTL